MSTPPLSFSTITYPPYRSSPQTPRTHYSRLVIWLNSVSDNVSGSSESLYTLHFLLQTAPNYPELPQPIPQKMDEVKRIIRAMVKSNKTFDPKLEKAATAASDAVAATVNSLGLATVLSNLSR